MTRDDLRALGDLLWQVVLGCCLSILLCVVAYFFVLVPLEWIADAVAEAMR